MYEILNKNKHYNIRDKIMYLDLKTQLQDEYCNVVNKFSMANQIEARAPFLDNEFTNLIFKISSNIRTKKNDFKNLLRKMMKNHIAKENLYNRKIGFIGLESQKLNYNFKNIRENLFNKKKIKAQEIFNYEFLDKFLESFENNNHYTEKNFLLGKYIIINLFGP